MNITGENLINGKGRMGQGGQYSAVEAATGKTLPGIFGGATLKDVNDAASSAWEAFFVYRDTSLEKRSAFLEKIAELIAASGDELIERTMAETGLPKARLEGERMRTVNQLKMFAQEVRSGHFLDRRSDEGNPARQPAAKPDLQYCNLAIGPVAIFGASNFPYAFSVAGGDTASALAAGCPVVVKAHPAHPATSEIIGRCIQEAVEFCGLPSGVFSLLHTVDHSVSQALVSNDHIYAVGFTGSRAGGLALMNVAASRPSPIPVYAEMSSINPVLLLPAALKNSGAKIGQAFASSLALGAGQFCTNPGLILALKGDGYDAFIKAACEGIKATPAQTMLTPNIANSYRNGIEKMENNSKTTVLSRGITGNEFSCQAGLFEVSALDFITDKSLHEEVFGSCSLVVLCQTPEELTQVLDTLEGQLTVAIHYEEADKPLFKSLLPKLEMLAGRLLTNGFGTGVEVSPAMVHGGPYPATSDSRTTSVGTAAIYRFLRPVCYQDFPSDILPATMR